jgi:dihydrofolate reductase
MPFLEPHTALVGSFFASVPERGCEPWCGSGRTIMRNLAVSVWMTVDGVFDADTMPEWFEPYRSAERDEYIRQTVHSADAFLVGRVTYEMLAAYWPNMKNNEFGIADRLNSMPKFVVSSTLKEATWTNSTIIKKDVVAEVAKLKKQPGWGILVSGSATLVETLLQAGLVDELRFLVHPIMTGSGKRFFKEGMGKTRLKLMKTEPFSQGVMFLRYQPASDGELLHELDVPRSEEVALSA